MELTQTRRANLLKLFADFVAKSQAIDPSSSPSGLDRVFAQKLQIHNTYFSGMKSGARPIGDKLARQIEANTGALKGWLDMEQTPVIEKPRDLKRFLEIAELVYLRSDKARRAELKAYLEESSK